MHGLVNRAVQGFVTDSYGQEVWDAVMRQADMGVTGFEPMLTYDDAQTPELIAAVCAVLERRATDVLEDIGTYLVSHPNTEALRRLMRFGGTDFSDFLHSLDDLPDRVRLAVPNLELPHIELRDAGQGAFELHCPVGIYGFAHVLVGLLRAMADDYGALALLEHSGGAEGADKIDITLIASDFAEGRSFSLGGHP